MANNILQIVYVDPKNLDDEYTVNYDIIKHSLSDRWIKKLEIAIKKYPIDEPNRFHGFDQEQETIKYIKRINEGIAKCNRLGLFIDRRLESLEDQDTLNYLHHEFEIGHGFLESKIHQDNRSELDLTLARLNTDIHACETLKRRSYPQHYVTWYGLPKFDKIREDEYSLFEDNYQFGSVYLLYTEIGKPLDDLAYDDDHYIGDDAFRPYENYSADFVVQFHNSDQHEMDLNRKIIKDFFDDNINYFQSRGVEWGDPRLTTGRLPLARLGKDNFDLNEIKKRQYVKEVRVL